MKDDLPRGTLCTKHRCIVCGTDNPTEPYNLTDWSDPERREHLSGMICKDCQLNLRGKVYSDSDLSVTDLIWRAAKDMGCYVVYGIVMHPAEYKEFCKELTRDYGLTYPSRKLKTYI